MLQLFGNPQLDTQFLPSERVTYLLCILAVRNTWVARDELCLLLWSEDTELEVARTRLRQLLYRAKQLGLASGIEAEPKRIRFVLPSDVQRFMAAVDQQRWQVALQAYQGSLLEGAVSEDVPEFASWLEYERLRFQTDFRQAVLNVVAQNPDVASPYLERMLRLEPLDNDLLQLALQIPSLSSKALDWHNQALRELNLEPERPTLNQLNALPAATTVFIGREFELETVQRLWQHPENRLVTIVGLGGIGKTRLALELAAMHSGKVVFVRLAAVDQVQLVPKIILEQMGYSPDGNAKKTLLEVLSNEKMLLVLDNLEQLQQIGELIAALLSAAPRLKILCTSREILGLTAEHLLELRGLPALNQDFALGDQDAARVFTSAAQRIQRTFTLENNDFYALQRIHKAVAGMPLGLELAAAWTRVMTLPEIATAIEADFEILSSTAADLPERQRSFKAVFAASWRLLSPQEQAALAQLSLLRGGFQANLAARVAGVYLPIILRLVNKSLVSRSGNTFYLHELIRQNAEPYLSQETRATTVDELLKVVFEQALEWSAKCYTVQHERLSDGLEVMHDNIRVALSAAFDSQTDKAVQLVAHLWYFWYSRGYLEEGIGWLDQAMRQHPSPDTATRIRLLIGFGDVARQFARFNESYAAADEVSQLSQATNDPINLADAERLRGDIALDQQDLERADQHFSAARAAFVDLEPERYATCTNNLGIVKHLRGELEAAKTLLEEALGLMRQRGDPQGIAFALEGLAGVLGQMGDYKTEKALLEQSLQVAKALHDPSQTANCLVSLAANAKNLGKPEQGRALLRQALELFWRSKKILSIGNTALHIANLESQSNPEWALRLSGSVQKHWQQLQILPDEQQHHLIASIRGQSGLEIANLHALELQGQTMSLEEMVLYALKDSSQVQQA